MFFFFIFISLLTRLYSHKFNIHLKQQLPTRDYTPEGREFHYFPLHLAKHFPVLWTTSILSVQQSCLDWKKGISYWAVTFAGLCSKTYNGGGEGGEVGTHQHVIRVQSPVRSFTTLQPHTEQDLWTAIHHFSSTYCKEQHIYLAFISPCQGWHSRCLYDLMFLFSFSKHMQPWP